VYEDKVYLATLDSKLVALDAKTGNKIWQSDIADPELGYSETMAPTVVKGKVLIGTNGGEYGIRGFVKAYDAKDGKLIWTFNTTPENSSACGEERRHRARHASRHRGREEEARRDRRSLQDARRRRVAEPIGRSRHQPHLLRGRQPLPDLDGSLRPGDNLYTNSLVSVDLDTASTPATSSTSRMMCGISTRSARPC